MSKILDDVGALDSEAILSEQGLLSDVIPSFQYRQSQRDLAVEIEQTISAQTCLVAEAGTGTGKTFSYLVPALLSGKKTIISTGTKNLQDQLFYRDLPLIRKSLGRPVTVALLKGRSNYLCKYRLEKQALDGMFVTKEMTAQFEHIRGFATQSMSGDINEINDIPESSGIWKSVISTSDNCLGTDCDFYDNCFLVGARQKALSADILVINHHLLFADMVIRDEGFGELLPGAHTLILDEAHQLPDIANQFFGIRVSSRRLNELAHDIKAQTLECAKDMPDLISMADALQHTVVLMRHDFGEQTVRRAWSKRGNSKVLDSAIEDVLDKLTTLSQMLDIAKVRSKGFAQCMSRMTDMIICFKMVTQNPPENYIHWYETYPKSFQIHLTPMNIAPQFKAHMESDKKAVIFTSATLTVDDKFDHFTELLGLTPDNQYQYDSPFDYQQQALLYLPKSVGDPKGADFWQRVADAAIPVIHHCQGRTFFLFTSHFVLQKVAYYLKDKIPYPLFVQGEKAKQTLVSDFQQSGNGVLLGTSSFWEGVDVRGEALSCVIIDKNHQNPP